ncbi:MAG: beta-propeller domain-containing protein [Methanoregula sp.]|nr:MAG: beta-propeller domain-containing protein [Methanoregula sp.]
MARHTILWLGLTLVLLSALLACGCMGTTTMAPAGEIKKFGSTDEIKQYIKENTQKVQEYGYGVTDGSVRFAEGTVAAPMMATQDAAKSSADFSGTYGTTDYSTTNVQVAGVDEPDFIKNDGRYIYIISGNTLAIVDAYPAQGAKVISKTEIADTVKEIFITGDRLVLFSTGNSDIPSRTVSGSTVGMEKVAMMPPYYRASPVTYTTVYDISDRKNPAVIKEYTIDGDYVDARMIKGIVYMLTRESVYSYDDIIVPSVRESGKVVIEPDVYYFNNPEYNYVFSTVTAIDATSGAEKDAKTFLIGSGNILYVSQGAMYVSYQKWHPVYRTYTDGPQIAVADQKVSVSSGFSDSAPILYEEFNRLGEAEKQEVIAAMKSGEQEAIRKREYDQTTTVIHKIAIGNGNIAYVANGEVSGYLKNQFAMDEYNGNLRVATTSNVVTTRGQYEYNNVFVLDGSMKTIGSLTHIAEQEKIYSTRFIGDRLYMVTFKRIDPFFVIDLSSPAHPKILGKLKIPGYSDYLHPYDSTHIIGVGKETATNDWGGVSTRGVKLALFDVSDVEHPKQVGKVEIGESGTDSAALYDHKAFLFDKEKNLLVLPIRQVTMTPVVQKPGYYDNQQRIWYGAYVFGVDPASGFVLRGTVEHGSGSSGYYWYGSSANEVKRSLYIGSNLYTISSAKIVATDLADINTTIKTIELPGGPDYRDVPMPMI